MTEVLERSTTASGPTPRSVLRASRGPAVVVLALVLVGVVLALVAGRSSNDALDPRSYGPGGAHALAVLLEQQGQRVEVVGTVEQVLAGDARDTVVVLPQPGRLAPRSLARLSSLTSRLLVVGATAAEVEPLDLPVEVADAAAAREVRQPACALPVAVRAGAVEVSGPRYAAAGGVGCYASDGAAALLSLQDGRRVLLGSGVPLSNDRLGQQGDASLAVGLLAGSERVLWLLPDPTRAAAPRASFTGTLPLWFRTAVGEVGVAVVVLALWRARRLGRVVVEPLPVVVRAAEAVEGRSRMYRAAGARDRAGDALRGATRERAGSALQLSRGASPEALVQAVADRAARPAAEVEPLLYGPPPVDDAALVRLADALVELETALAAPPRGGPRP